ncbi:hypothetical protein [Cellulomonas fimi]|uniref:Lipoprotein n=1 Tax=Cellulomonas fimi TaxID=1708 RepID=A0A7Y0QI62_CELFI|nr:hypothetical protein [Cellulomonas fimi]NMR21000.1 hypothetical protein [Cellulomonas fimi]
MTDSRQLTRALAVAVAGILAVGACSSDGQTPTPSRSAEPSTSPSPSPSPEPFTVTTSSPAAPLTVVAEGTDVAASLRTSRALFAKSSVAVVAPTGQPEAQRLAARVSVGVGVPLLVGGAAPGAQDTPDPALADELERLAVSAVVVVGDVAGFAADDVADGDATASPGPTASSASGATDGGDGTGPDATGGDEDVVVVRSEATAAALAQATGLAVEAPAPADPATFAAEVAALVPGTAPATAAPSGTAPSGTAPSDARTSATSPSTTPVANDDQLPDLTTVTRGAPVTDVVALAIDDPLHVAAIATARAAEVSVHLVPASAPNPQAHAGVIEALQAAAAPKTLAVGAAFGAEPALDWKVRSARSGAQLLGGGQLLFPQRQYVALYGTPATGALGVLGEQPVTAAVQRAREHAAPYQAMTAKTVVPTFEIIATVASAGPGDDGNYSNEQSVDLLRPWVDEAAAAGMYVVLDLQPGRADFLSQARLYEELLLRPNVGLALDPEWRLGPDEVPLQRIGSVGAAEVNQVVTYLADLTNANDLPPKMLVLHQFQLRMLPDRAAIDVTRPELAVVIHADGQGGQVAKQDTWRVLHQDAPAGVAWGWKNFYDEDKPMLTPEQTVQTVTPVPDLVTYQ